VLDGVLRLEPGDDGWERLETGLRTPRGYARAVAFGDGVLVVGGSTAAGASHASEGSAVVERFTAKP
jgi:N-acetylneuraminic acid mutarotase